MQMITPARPDTSSVMTNAAYHSGVCVMGVVTVMMEVMSGTALRSTARGTSGRAPPHASASCPNITVMALKTVMMGLMKKIAVSVCVVCVVCVHTRARVPF